MMPALLGWGIFGHGGGRVPGEGGGRVPWAPQTPLLGGTLPPCWCLQPSQASFGAAWEHMHGKFGEWAKDTPPTPRGCIFAGGAAPPFQPSSVPSPQQEGGVSHLSGRLCSRCPPLFYHVGLGGRLMSVKDGATFPDLGRGGVVAS